MALAIPLANPAAVRTKEPQGRHGRVNGNRMLTAVRLLKNWNVWSGAGRSSLLVSAEVAVPVSAVAPPSCTRSDAKSCP